MRLWLALAPAVLLAISSVASAEPGARDEPAMRVEAQRFELFGTSFCAETEESCDVAVPAEHPAVNFTPAALPDTRQPRKILGVSVCLAPRKTGPACDLTWVMPDAYAAWRDYPEVRLLATLDR